MNAKDLIPGKFYKTRDGHKVSIYRTDARGDYPVHGCIHLEKYDVAICWTEDLRCIVFVASDQYDIISEWTEPVTFDWRQVPLCCNWIAMDKGGNWYGYMEKPKAKDTVWSFDNYYVRIHSNHSPQNFTGDWTQSLIERPKE